MESGRQSGSYLSQLMLSAQVWKGCSLNSSGMLLFLRKVINSVKCNVNSTVVFLGCCT